MREIDFYADIALTILNCGPMDLEKAREIINKTGEEIYDDFLNEMSDSEIIDPVAIAYEIILRRAKEELSKLIEDAVEWHEDDDEYEDEYEDDLLAEYDKTIEEIYTYGNFLATSYDGYSMLAEFLERIQFKDFLKSENISISNSLKFFLEEISVDF